MEYYVGHYDVESRDLHSNSLTFFGNDFTQQIKMKPNRKLISQIRCMILFCIILMKFNMTLFNIFNLFDIRIQRNIAYLKDLWRENKNLQDGQITAIQISKKDLTQDQKFYKQLMECKEENALFTVPYGSVNQYLPLTVMNNGPKYLYGMPVVSFSCSLS